MSRDVLFPTIFSMTELRPEETLLKGEWTLKGESIIADEVCHRIDWLTKSQLKYLAATADGWDKLYQDPADGRLWELTHLQSEMHGGGPPQLALLSPEVATEKYKVNGQVKSPL